MANNNNNNNKQFSMDISNCGFIDPQAQLAAALMNMDIREFRSALDMGARPTAQDSRHMSIYEKALSTPGCAEFVEECLRRGCNVNYINQHLNKAAINFAADSHDPQILTVLLRQRGVQLDRKYAQLTPLNSLAKNLNGENVKNVAACMKLLLDCGASPNIADQREMTPLHYILKNRKIDEHKMLEMVEMFLTQSELDVDTYRNGEVRNLLSSQFPAVPLPPVRTNGANVSYETLLRCLQRGDEPQFLQQFAEYQLEKEDMLKHVSQAQYLPLFVEAIKRGMCDAFDVLLQTELDINSQHEAKTPIEIAIIWGNWRALQKLLQHDELALRPHVQLLNAVIGKIDEPPLDDYCDYGKCFELLLDSARVDVNETDRSGSTPLHYAVRYRNAKVINALLKRGAYIGMKSAFSDLPIDGMQPELLEEHFDNCITTNGLKPGEQGFEIIINYMNLMRREPCAQNDKIISSNLHDEMSPIAFIADSKEYRHLLQHPLITSFLFLKWHRLSVIFYINFLLYAFFAVSIITHTVLKFSGSDNEPITTLFGLLSWIGIAYLIVRECLQFVMSPTVYFRSIINYMEMLLIILAIATCIESSYDHKAQRVVAVFTILLVALELCLLVGSLPVLSISTHMLMLRAVSRSFLKSFTFYSIFVITFSLCFYIMLGKPEDAKIAADKVDNNNNNNNNADADDNAEFNKFSNPFLAIIKTIVMLTGEFDAGDIQFDTLYSYLVFLLFVFFMSIVLFNLLNGLAVSDTQAIKAQAELNGSICRTNLLTRYESVLTGRSGRMSFIVNHEPFRTISRRLMNVYPNYITGRQIAILPNNNNKVLIPISNSYELKEMSNRANGVGNTKANFLPLSDNDNERQKRLLDPPVQFLPCCCSFVTGKCSEMDSRTVKLALNVLDQKSNTELHRQRQQNTEQRLQLIEHKIDRLLELLQERQ